jgi:hypothetical protein
MMDWACGLGGDLEFFGWKSPGKLSWRQECYIEMDLQEICWHGI